MNKKLLIAAMAAVSAQCALGAIVYPEAIWTSDLREQFAANGARLEAPWVTYGTGAQPAGDWYSLFPTWEAGPYYSLISVSGDVVALSCSSFDPTTQADEWLVTPEFTVTADKVLLKYTVSAQGSDTPTPMEIRISESGSAKEDFGEPILDTTFKGSADGIKMNDRFLVLEGYKGKTIRLAFINKGENQGVLGFSSIDVRPYWADVTSYTPQFVTPGTAVQFRYSATLAMPETVNGFTALLELSDGTTQTYKSSKSYSTISATQKFTFPDKVTVSADEPINYKVTLTPNKEGFPPVVITGAIACGTPIYDPAVLIEEFTGTWCGWCPRGAAALAYYRDTYGMGSESPYKVYGVAVHSGDVMQVEDNLYYEDLNTLPIAPTNLPGAIFNRQFMGEPSSLETVERLLAQKSFGSVAIENCTFDESCSKGVIDYVAALSLDVVDPEINVSVIVTENDVALNKRGYSQTNYFYDKDEEYLKENYPEVLVPYLQPYINQDDEVIEAGEVVFEEVARGCSPSLAGQPLAAGVWTPGQVVNGSVEFEIPKSVLDIENLEMTLVLTDATNGEVLSCDRTSVARILSVNDISGDSKAKVSVRKNGHTLNVTCEGENIALYTADGRLLGSGHGNVIAHGIEGIVIIHTNTGTLKVAM